MQKCFVTLLIIKSSLAFSLHDNKKCEYSHCSITISGHLRHNFGVRNLARVRSNSGVMKIIRCHVLYHCLQAAQALDVNKLFNSDTVTQRTIYRDCMGNLPLC